MLEKYINKDIKVIIKSIIVYVLFTYSSLLQYLPIIIFNLDINIVRNNKKLIVLLSAFSSCIFALFLLIVYKKDLKDELKKFKNSCDSNLKTGFKYYFIGIAVMMISNIILTTIFKSNGANNEQAVQSMIKTLPIVMILQAGILAPFNEEIVFRKTLYDIFKKNKYIFACLSFLLFGGAHVLSSATTIVDYLYIIPYGALGAAFAFAYSKTKTIFTSMTIHMIHNTVLLILSIFVF